MLPYLVVPGWVVELCCWVPCNVLDWVVPYPVPALYEAGWYPVDVPVPEDPPNPDGIDDVAPVPVAPLNPESPVPDW